MSIVVVFTLELALSAMFSFIFFLLGIYEGVFQKKDGNFTRAIICHLISLPFSILTIAMVLTSGESYAIAFQWGFVFFTFLDLILIVINGWQSYLAYEEGQPNRNKRWSR